MYTIKPCPTAVTLFERAGRRWKFASVNEFFSQFGSKWACINVGTHFDTYSHTAWKDARGFRANSFDHGYGVAYPERVYARANYILRDDVGQPVELGTLYWRPAGGRAPSRKRKSSPAWQRFGAVPGTGKSRGGRCGGKDASYARTQREGQFFEEEGEMPLRHKAVLWVGWYDYDYYRRGTRSWKNYRKTQWK